MSSPTRTRRRDMRRGNYAFSLDPRLIAEIEILMDLGIFRSRSHGVEQGLRLIIEKHREDLASAGHSNGAEHPAA